MSSSKHLQRTNKQFHHLYEVSKQVIYDMIKIQHTIKNFCDEAHKLNEDMILVSKTSYIAEVFEDWVKFRNQEFIQDNVLWKLDQNIQIYDIIQ